MNEKDTAKKLKHGELVVVPCTHQFETLHCVGGSLGGHPVMEASTIGVAPTTCWIGAEGAPDDPRWPCCSVPIGTPNG